MSCVGLDKAMPVLVALLLSCSAPAGIDKAAVEGDELEEPEEEPCPYPEVTADATGRKFCPGGPWGRLAMGSTQLCGVHEDGCLECWGHADGNVPDPVYEGGGAGQRASRRHLLRGGASSPA